LHLIELFNTRKKRCWPVEDRNENRRTKPDPDQIRLIDSLNQESWDLRYEDPGASGVSAEKALRLAKQRNYFRGQAYACLNLGEEALSCYQKSLELADKLGAKPLQVDAHYALADYYESAGEFEKALHHYKNYRSIDQPMERQKAILQERFFSWKGEVEQIDDVVMIGIRI
jgi:tetratricopeptide (TPR) repeat protein